MTNDVDKQKVLHPSSQKAVGKLSKIITIHIEIPLCFAGLSTTLFLSWVFFLLFGPITKSPQITALILNDSALLLVDVAFL